MLAACQREPSETTRTRTKEHVLQSSQYTAACQQASWTVLIFVCVLRHSTGQKVSFFDWCRWALLACFCRLEVNLGNLGLRDKQKWPKKNLKHNFCCKMMKNGQCLKNGPRVARIPRNSAEGAFHTYTNPKKRGIFRGKLSIKGTFWEVFQPEFRGIPRRFRKPPKSAKCGISALKLTKIAS